MGDLAAIDEREMDRTLRAWQYPLHDDALLDEQGPEGEDPAARARRAETIRWCKRMLDQAERDAVPASATLAMSMGQADGGGYERQGRYQHRLECSAERRRGSCAT